MSFFIHDLSFVQMYNSRSPKEKHNRSKVGIGNICLDNIGFNFKWCHDIIMYTHIKEILKEFFTNCKWLSVWYHWMSLFLKSISSFFICPIHWVKHNLFQDQLHNSVYCSRGYSNFPSRNLGFPINTPC